MQYRSGSSTVATLSGAVLLALAGCGGGPSTLPPADNSGADDTTLGAGDVFDVRVFGEEQLTGSYRISQDGSIDYPLVGRIEVAGLEPTQISDLIQTRLVEGRYLVQPQVSIYVREYNSKRISVHGAVSRAGTFPMSSGLTVVQAISLAGGLTSIADGNGTVVSRRVDGQLQRFNVAVVDVSEGAADDVSLRAGDIIYVPERVF